MFNVAKSPFLSGFKDLTRIFEQPGSVCVQVATIMKLKPPISFDHVQYPSRRRPKLLERRPLLPSFVGFPPLKTKSPWLIKGPEEHHNRIIYGEFGIQALEGGRLRTGHLDGMRMIILRNMDEKTMFATWRIPSPWLAVSSKGLGKKMGQGKGPINRFEVPVKAGRMIIEIGGALEIEQCEPFLKRVLNMLPFEAKIVSRESQVRDAQIEKEKELANQHPFTFKYCVKNNFLGIDRVLSPYDYKWDGKYNKKSHRRGR